MYQIVFVDDEFVIREGVSENIKWNELGYQLAAVCENGREAWEVLQKIPVDVVITDICMPFMDGIELSAKIKEQYPRIKTLILSGYDDFDYAKKTIKYGVEDYILKPITSYELTDVLVQLKSKLDAEAVKRKEQEEMYGAYRKGQMLLYSEALVNAIIGRTSEMESEKDLENVGVKLKGPYFLVGIASLSIYMGDYELEEERKKESALMSFIVFNLALEIMEKHNKEDKGLVCQGHNDRVYLLFQTDDKETMEKRIHLVCQELIDQVNESMGMHLNIGLGSWEEGTRNMYRSYETAESALVMQYTDGENCIIDGRKKEDKSGYVSEIERVLDNSVRHIRENNREKMQEDLLVLKNIFQICEFSKREVQIVFEKLETRIQDLLKAVGAEWKDGQQREQMESASGLDEALARMLSYEQNAAKALEEISGSSSRSYAYQAYEFIETHYSDSNLSLQDVCSHLGVSVSRFSQIFKQTFGTTFLDALIGIRMEKAKELLVLTDMKNYEIASKVGFVDPHYFSIAFKKATGKTPKEYAKERKRNEI